MSNDPIHVATWNVNGLRAIHGKGFLEWLEGSRMTIVGLQETRATAEQLPDELRAPAGWHTHFQAAERLGYSGVGLYSRLPIDAVETSIGVDRYDREGRVQRVRFGALTVVNVYFPNGNGKERDNSRVPYKLQFYRRLYKELNAAKLAGERLLVMGDFNTAHETIDLARPTSNKNTSGFLLEEREELSRWLRGGWVDTFRHFEPGPEHYTWWTQRGDARERNVGWRLDMIYASPGALPFVRSATIHKDVHGSDHCPVSVELDPAVLKG